MKNILKTNKMRTKNINRCGRDKGTAGRTGTARDFHGRSSTSWKRARPRLWSLRGLLGSAQRSSRRVGEICCFPAPRAPQDLRASITPFRPSQGLKGLEKDLFPCCLSHKALFFSLPEPSRVRLWRVSRPRVRAPAGEEGARGGRAPGLRAAGRARTPGGLGWGVELAKAEL